MPDQITICKMKRFNYDLCKITNLVKSLTFFTWFLKIFHCFLGVQIVSNWTMMPDQDKISASTKVCWIGSSMMKNHGTTPLHRFFNYKIRIFGTLSEAFGIHDPFCPECPTCTNYEWSDGSKLRHSVWKLPKMSHFEVFSIFVLFVTCLVTLFDRKIQISKT